VTATRPAETFDSVTVVSPSVSSSVADWEDDGTSRTTNSPASSGATGLGTAATIRGPVERSVPVGISAVDP
jgi:hypothetical protein